jgi:hypothetical protein
VGLPREPPPRAARLTDFFAKIFPPPLPKRAAYRVPSRARLGVRERAEFQPSLLPFLTGVSSFRGHGDTW